MVTEKRTISIPDDLDFSELRLTRDPQTGEIEFDWAPIERICAASGLDVALFRSGPEGNVAGFLTAWYFEHLARGGATDPVQEDLLIEMRAEDERGGGLSHKPGRA